jgi:putative endonuclease
LSLDPRLREDDEGRERIAMSGFVCILASGRNGTIYIGVTADLIKRIYEHKNKLAAGFTKKYSVDKLIYYEIFGDISEAIYREKCLKKWGRRDKITLIEK